MAQVESTYQRSLEEYGRKWFRQGHDEGMRQGHDEGMRQGRDEGQFAMLGQLIRQKFGHEAVEELSSLLGQVSGPQQMASAARAVLEAGTIEEFLVLLQRLLRA